MVLEVCRGPLDLGEAGRPLDELDHEGDVGDGQAKRLDARQPLLVGERRHLQG